MQTNLALRNLDYRSFAEDFLKEYLSRGMGTLSKREIDVLVMHLLHEHGQLDLKDNHELSIALQLSETRIKGLRYEARLKYPPDEDKFVERRFLYALARGQFDSDSGRVVFVMEDSYLRQAIQGRLKERGAFADTSFNSELVKVRIEHLEPILRSFYGKDISTPFVKDMKKAVAKDAAVKFADVKKSFVLGAAKALGSGTVTAVKTLLTASTA